MTSRTVTHTTFCRAGVMAHSAVALRKVFNESIATHLSGGMTSRTGFRIEIAELEMKYYFPAIDCYN